MTPARRVGAAGIVSAIGAFAGLAGASITWWTVIGPSGNVEAPGLGRAVFPRHVISVSGGEAAGGLRALLLLIGIAAVLTLLAGPRARTALLVAMPLLAAAVVVLTLGASVSDAVEVARDKGFVGTVFRIEDGSFLAKALVFMSTLSIVGGAVVALPVARAVGRVRMPEI